MNPVVVRERLTLAVLDDRLEAGGAEGLGVLLGQVVAAGGVEGRSHAGHFAVLIDVGFEVDLAVRTGARDGSGRDAEPRREVVGVDLLRLGGAGERLRPRPAAAAGHADLVPLAAMREHGHRGAATERADEVSDVARTLADGEVYLSHAHDGDGRT